MSYAGDFMYQLSDVIGRFLTKLTDESKVFNNANNGLLQRNLKTLIQ